MIATCRERRGSSARHLAGQCRQVSTKPRLLTAWRNTRGGGASGLYRIDGDGTRTLVLAAGNLVGVAFDPSGGVVVASNDTAYRLDPGAVAIGRPELL